MASNELVKMKPYGELGDGSLGFAVDANDAPEVSVCEVLSSLPTTDDPNNFVGRLVFDTSADNIFIFQDTPSAQWIGLQASAVQVAAAVPTPALSPATGDLYYSTDTEILYLWDGVEWVPVGGQRGCQVIWQHYTGDGLTTTFATGATSNPPVEYVQVYIDGAVQQPGSNGVRDYYMVGNNVEMNSAPANSTAISVRTLTYIDALRNSTFVQNRYTVVDVGGGLGDNDFDTGVFQAAAGQLFVYLDGVHQIMYNNEGAGTYDYRVISQNLEITALVSSGTTCTATTAEAHGYSIGETITVSGALESDYNGTFTITDVASSTSFEYTAGGTPSASPATANPKIIFSPTKTNDRIVFVDNGVDTPPVPGQVVTIVAIDNVTAGTVDGETNLMQNTGGGAGVYKEKSGVTFTLKSIVGGSRITVTEGTNEITISAENDRVMSVTTFNGVPSTYTVGSQESYIAVRNASGGAVTVDLGDIALDPSETGRHVIIKDEANNAATHNISVTIDASSSIDGQSAGTPYVISEDGGSVHVVFDGADWHVIYREPGPAGPAGSTGLTGAQGDPGSLNNYTRTDVDGATDPYVVVQLDEYLAINNTSGSALTIDLETSFVADDAGYTIVIKDEGRNAGTHTISIDPGTGRAIDGLAPAATLDITSDGGSAKLMWDGANWHTIP